MNKINNYLFLLTNKYLLINFIVISLFILFINSLELSRVLQENDKDIFNFLYLSLLKYPSILSEIIPFVTIISIAFLMRNLINNNEFISMRNLGFSIFDIFYPIGIAVFVIGLFFLLILNPLSVFLEKKYDKRLDNKENSLYSIKISNNEMWIKNRIDSKSSNFINIKDIDIKDMKAQKIKILLTDKNSNTFLIAEKGEFLNNVFKLKNVSYYNLKNDQYKKLAKYDFEINFNKNNIINSISKYKLIPFYNYISHSRTLSKFNLYSSEICLYYLSELLKPIFIVMLWFVIIGFTSKFQRNENFFKVLFLAISVGFIIFLIKEIITRLTINLSINYILSYLIIFLLPFFIGLYQILKIENE